MSLLETQHFYDVDADKIYQLVTDQDFLQQRYEAIGSKNLEFKEFNQDGDTTRIRLQRDIPLQPWDVAKSFFNETAHLDETLTWQRNSDGTAHCDYQCVIDGLESDVTGSFDLRNKDEGCVEDITVTALVKMPAGMGKAMANYVQFEIKENLNREQAFTRLYLDRQS